MSGSGHTRQRARRHGAALLTTVLAASSMPAAAGSLPAADPWQPAQVIRIAGPGEGVGLAAAAVLDDGSTLVIHTFAGAFWQSSREPGGDWSEPQRVEPPDASVNGLGSAAVSPAGTVWLTYSVATQDADAAHVVRMSGDQPETVLTVSSNESAGSLTVDREGDVLFTVQGSSREGAWYGDQGSRTLTRLAPRTRFFSFHRTRGRWAPVTGWPGRPSTTTPNGSRSGASCRVRRGRRSSDAGGRRPRASITSTPTSGSSGGGTAARCWRGASRTAGRDTVTWCGWLDVNHASPGDLRGSSGGRVPTPPTRRTSSPAVAHPVRRLRGVGPARRELHDSRIVGYFVRPRREPERQVVAEQVGDGGAGFTVDTGATGRLLVVWDSVPPGSEKYATQVAEGRVRGELARQPLFTDAQSRGLLRPGGEATVIADTHDGHLLSRSTD